MSTPARKPALDPLISRQYEPSRLQDHTLICTYALLIPIASRRFGSPRSQSGEPGRAEAWVGDSRPRVAGA